VSITTESIQQYIGKTLFDDGGHKIGKIGAVFLDDITGNPEWVTVSTGFFGTNESFVPAADASARDDGLTVPYSKDRIKAAPNVDVEQGHLSTDEEASLYRYYGLHYGSDQHDQNQREQNQNKRDESARDESARDDSARDDSSGLGKHADTSAGFDAGSDAGSDHGTGKHADTNSLAGSGTDSASSGLGDDAMTRSEERVHVGTQTVTTGRARLRKWVETEHQQVVVPVRKEKVRLETEPITDANRGESPAGPELSEGQDEVTVREERPVVRTEAVPVERVRLAKEAEEETRTVQADVRKERVDLDSDQDVTDRR
jgi:uncharacterized protein (TIGR02271 family)